MSSRLRTSPANRSACPVALFLALLGTSHNFFDIKKVSAVGLTFGRKRVLEGKSTKWDADNRIPLNKTAESEGFKPPVRINRTADFESAPFDHSGNFPI